MTAVDAYPPANLFEDHLDRILAPAPETRAAFLASSSELFRDMSFDPADYYSSSLPARQQPLEARPPSVLSVSSSASYSTPHSSQHGAVSRTLSPASGTSEPATVATTMTAGSTYQQPSYTSPNHPASLMPSPSQYFPRVQVYSTLPNLRQYTPTTTFGYAFGSLPSHSSPLSIQSFPTLDYQNFTPTTYPSSASALQQYHSSAMLPNYRNPIMTKQQPPRESTLLKGLQKLPQEVIDRIHSTFTYLECWKIYAVCRWFKENFDPHKLPENDKIAGVRYAEQYYRRYFPGRATTVSADGRTREYDSKHPGSFGCYHCFRIRGPEHFELFKWNNQREDEQDSSDADSSSTPRQTQATLPPPASSSSSRNPHYDPTLTRSNMTAAAAASSRKNRSSRAGSAATTHSSPSSPTTGTTTAPTKINSTTQQGGSMPMAESPRIKETWGIRRFCIECGIQRQYYRPGDLIELCKPKEAVWVCQCWKIHKRPQEIKCMDCDSFIPLSAPHRRR